MSYGHFLIYSALYRILSSVSTAELLPGHSQSLAVSFPRLLNTLVCRHLKRIQSEISFVEVLVVSCPYAANGRSPRVKDRDLTKVSKPVDPFQDSRLQFASAVDCNGLKKPAAPTPLPSLLLFNIPSLHMYSAASGHSCTESQDLRCSLRHHGEHCQQTSCHIP